MDLFILIRVHNPNIFIFNPKIQFNANYYKALPIIAVGASSSVYFYKSMKAIFKVIKKKFILQ